MILMRCRRLRYKSEYGSHTMAAKNGKQMVDFLFVLQSVSSVVSVSAFDGLSITSSLE
jgi:hypothetical protein